MDALYLKFQCHSRTPKQTTRKRKSKIENQNMNLKENNSPISLSSLNSFSTAIFHPQRSITLSIHDGILKKLKLSESLKLISSLSHRLSVFLSRHFYS
ncbi:hypothetical protein ES288_A05G297600v1 [Gossypium darwinii]|uniref:Uncharacterized protein n=1 Tax=Gossypium darwinii TaxID=34276 RepID=A0A5D2GKT9_GOSDA|nr:hypothetical protein ES288_A05G297600v1 [Gossypium darwinii]